MQNNFDEKKQLLLDFPKLNTILIEKDILLSEILSYIVDEFKDKKWENNYYLCGGTSLSKCYKTTDRLSEDIDISIFGYSKTQGKKIIKEISNLIDQMEKKQLFEIKNRSNPWNQERIFLNCDFTFKKHKFSLDIKWINLSIKRETISQNKIYTAAEKKYKIEPATEKSIPVIDAKVIVSEKLLVFQKKYSNKIASNKTIDKKDFDDDNRLFRHIYDIFMIFNNKIIELTKTDIKEINVWFDKIKEIEKDFETPFNKLDILNSNFFEEQNKKKMKELLDRECYGKSEMKNIVNFYKELEKMINN